MSDFLEQYKANCRSYVRRTPYRLLRLLVAFMTALALAPVCALAARLTGEPIVAMVIGVIGAVGVLAAWILIERAIQRRVEPSEHQTTGQSPYAGPASLPGLQVEVTPELVHSGKADLWQPPMQSPSRSSGCGCLIAMLILGGVTLFSCCGGAALLLAIGARVAGHRDGQIAVQQDSIFDPHRQHEQNLEDLIRNQEEQLRAMERDRRTIGINPFGIETRESLPRP